MINTEISTEKVFEILFEYAVGDEIMTAAIEEFSKPVSKEFLKQPIAICPKCQHFQIECICND